MARNVYDSETKSAILNAVNEARSAKKKWPEAHKAAKEAGYKGGLPSLMIMYRKARSARRGDRPARGPGRPRKVTVANSYGMSAEIERIVSDAVQARVNSALDAAIAELEKMKM
ncbi:MAG TPA: hypothetical protein VEK08_14100 [Planctomycetota bacterium]|nr:hypothetical protein [Planctomycetota bacterium]